MMISAAMNAKLNEQLAAEFSAAHEYLSMACALEAMDLKVLSKRFQIQSEEEREHGMKIVRYVHDVGGTVTLDAIAKPSCEFSSPEAVVRKALESERRIAKMINDLLTFAESEKDHATRSFLQWFVDEQVEEVASMRDLLSLVQMACQNMLQVEARVRHDMAGQSS
ncbi:MAG: ferritin [Phycisphaerae bacterium]